MNGFTNPKLSIVIVSYNVQEFLLDCLRSIYMYPFKSMEVFVVDNHSTDNSVELIRAEFPDVRLICNATNAGFPVANNQAIEQARGEYIFLLNPDTLLLDNALEKLVKFMEQDEELMLLAPKLLNRDGSVQFSIQPFISIAEIISETFYLHGPLKWLKSYHRKKIEGPIRVQALSGAAILVRRKVFERIGMLDPELFWTEDMEFCYRAYRHHYKIMYHPEIRIMHYGSSSGKKNPDIMISNQILSKVRYFKKNHSKFEFLLAWIFRLLHILIRIAIFAPLALIWNSGRIKLKAYIFTLQRFIHGKY